MTPNMVTGLVQVRPNKKISVFRLTFLKILDSVNTYFFKLFFLEKTHNFMHFKRHFAF